MLNRPLTLTEKILYAHLCKTFEQPFIKGYSHFELYPDRLAMHDAAAQMPLLQFSISTCKKVKVSTTVHCDHLILAEKGAKEDLEQAIYENKEIFEFLQNASNKFGIDYWKPGAGIMHQVIFENYSFPGGILLGTDSNISNAGGLGMLSFGVGGVESVDAMIGLPWEIKMPRIIGVKLVGKLNGWASAKDIFLKLAGILTKRGGNGAIIEYFGEGTETLSCTAKGTICNMSSDLGAETSIFPYDSRMGDYLRATGRGQVADLAEENRICFVADEEVLQSPDKFYDQIITIDLTDLEPHINGPNATDLAWKLSEFAQEVRRQGFLENISAALIGSCINSSYEDMDRAASIAKQALKHGLRSKCNFMITPGSEQLRSTIEKNGQLKILQELGGLILASASGPCIGQWKRHDVPFGQNNTILSSYGRNSLGRNDANPGTFSFIASPEMVVAFALAGKLTFNPMVEPLINEEGLPVKLQPPIGADLPHNGFEVGDIGYIAPEENGESIKISIDVNSSRLQILEPFSAWKNADFENLRILAKLMGKCTIDQISPAGKWLKFRGHLDNISDNFLSGAMNAFNETIGKAKNFLSNDLESFAKIARHYKSEHLGWVMIGEESYGEGTSREHAAIEPRHLGGRAVIAKSFARSYELDLKKQGILALIFSDPADYSKIQEEDILSISDISAFAPNNPFTLILQHKDGTTDKIMLNHSYTEDQVIWFRVGGVLNSLTYYRS